MGREEGVKKGKERRGGEGRGGEKKRTVNIKIQMG